MPDNKRGRADDARERKLYELDYLQKGFASAGDAAAAAQRAPVLSSVREEPHSQAMGWLWPWLIYPASNMPTSKTTTYWS